MTKTFLPDYASRRVGADFHALYRFFENEDWSHVCEAEKPKLFKNSGDAREAAKEVLRKTLNPAIYCHRSARRAVIDVADEFFQTKHELAARAHTARKRGLREVVYVETKRGRHAESS